MPKLTKLMGRMVVSEPKSQAGKRVEVMSRRKQLIATVAFHSLTEALK